MPTSSAYASGLYEPKFTRTMKSQGRPLRSTSNSSTSPQQINVDVSTIEEAQTAAKRSIGGFGWPTACKAIAATLVVGVVATSIAVPLAIILSSATTTITTTTSTTTTSTTSTSTTSTTSTSTTSTTTTSTTTTSTTSTSTTTTTTTSTTTTSTTTTSTTTTSTTSTSTTTTTTTSTTSTSTTSTSTTTRTTTTTTSTTTTSTTPAPPCSPVSVGSSSSLYTASSGSSSYACQAFQWVSPTTGTVTFAFQLRHDPDYWYVDDVSVYNGAVQMLVNGGFESGTLSPWVRTTPNGNCGGAPGAVGSASPHSGSYHLWDGSNGCADQISQSFAATAGQSYIVSFWIKAPVGGSGISASVTLS